MTIVTIVLRLSGVHRFRSHFVAQLRVKVCNFFRALFIDGEPALPTLGNQDRVRPKLGLRQKPVAGFLEQRFDCYELVHESPYQSVGSLDFGLLSMVIRG
jgi:hypothetical protein